MKKEELLKLGLEQLAEKQGEEMDQMLARRYELPIPTHSDDQVRASTLSELFSGLPYEHDQEQ